MTIQAVERHESGAHIALLDVTKGAGILVAPSSSFDLHLGGPTSLLATDWDALVKPLARAGWTFLADEDDLPVSVATLPDGSRVHGLYPAHLDDSPEPLSERDEEGFRCAVLDLMTHYATQQS